MPIYLAELKKGLFIIDGLLKTYPLSVELTNFNWEVDALILTAPPKVAPLVATFPAPNTACKSGTTTGGNAEITVVYY